MKKAGILAIIILLLFASASIVFAENEITQGSFLVGNTAPTSPWGWTICALDGSCDTADPDLETHYKSTVAFNWDCFDTNDDTLNYTLCVSTDDDYSVCEVYSTTKNGTIPTLSATDFSNWDYEQFSVDAADANKNYYVNFTCWDGTTYGNSNQTLFNLTNNYPSVAWDSGGNTRGDATCEVTPSGSYTQPVIAGLLTDSNSDNTSMTVCNATGNPLVESTGSCTNGLNDCFASNNASAGKRCTVTDDFITTQLSLYSCDYVLNDSTGPSSCKTTSVNTTAIEINHVPNDYSEFTLTAPANADGSVSGNASGYTDNDGTATLTNGDGDTHNEERTDANGGSPFECSINGGAYGDYNAGGDDYLNDDVLENVAIDASYIACGTVQCGVNATDICDEVAVTKLSNLIVIPNTAPTLTGTPQVRYGAAAYGNMNSTTTHDNTPTFRVPITDIDITDASGQQVTVSINLSASTPGADDAGGPYTNTAVVNGNVDVTATTELAYDGISKTYYVSVEIFDNATCGSNFGTTTYYEFNLTNNLAYINVLNTTITHDNTPSISWTITDADDGTDGKWPADDTWNSNAWIIDSANGTIYCSYVGTTINAEQTTCQLPWGTTGTVWANRTINTTVWTEDKFAANAGYHAQGSQAVNTTKQFILYDFLPDIKQVEMTDTGAYSTCTAVAGGCALNPVEGSNTTIAVRVAINDTDDDCDTVTTTNLNLCLFAAGTCDETTRNYTWPLDSITKSGTECTLTFTTNKTAADGTPEFFILPNDSYKLHINSTSQAGERTSDTEQDRLWEYGSLRSVNYSAEVTLGGGTPTLGQWNDGTDIYTVTNFGNLNLNLEWNASDPTSPEDSWQLNGTDMYIDDDISYSSEATGMLSPAALNGTLNTFVPASGLNICTRAACDTNMNETLNTTFHIFPPSGITAGIYNSTIVIEIS